MLHLIPALLTMAISPATPSPIYASKLGDHPIFRVDATGKAFLVKSWYTGCIQSDNRAGTAVIWNEQAGKAFLYTKAAGLKQLKLPAEVATEAAKHQKIEQKEDTLGLPFSVATGHDGKTLYVWSPSDHKIFERAVGGTQWTVSPSSSYLKTVPKSPFRNESESGSRIALSPSDKVVAVEITTDNYANESGASVFKSDTWIVGKGIRPVKLGAGSPLGWLSEDVCLLWSTKSDSVDVVAVNRSGKELWRIDTVEHAAVFNGTLYLARQRAPIPRPLLERYDIQGKVQPDSIRLKENYDPNDRTGRSVSLSSL